MTISLFFRPSYEVATEYISTYCQALVEEAVANGHDVTDLYGEMATEENFMVAIEERKPELCFMLGHGRADSFFGQDDKMVLMACVNDDLLKGSVNAFVSCLTGIQLGPSMVSKDAIGYIGYQADFIFLADESLPVLEDIYARGFMDAAMTPIRVLLNGGNLADAYAEAVKKFNEWIMYWKASNNPAADEIVKYLYHDRDNLIAIGQGFPILKRVGQKTAPLIALLLVKAFTFPYLATRKP